MATVELLQGQTKLLSSLLEQLKPIESYEKKLALLQESTSAKTFLEKVPVLKDYYEQLGDLEKFTLHSIDVIGQAENVFRTAIHQSDTKSRLKSLVEQLIVFEKFYKDIGGIIGYHQKMIDLICASKIKSSNTNKKIYQALGPILDQDSKATDQFVIEGIKALPYMAEIYPIGGAGDRLNLSDEKTGLPLPTAKLNFLGQSLLSGMIKDLQAREYLYFKLYEKQLLTPIAMMTSEAKKNHQFVQQICTDNEWYHRPQDSFFLFKQPLAPVLTVDGQWSLSDSLKLFLKPSGHGVIWKLAKDHGVFDWFKQNGKTKALVRQMNNPIAAIDCGIFALLGLGYSKQKAFGFASCQRFLHAAEGVNVLSEKEIDGKYHYTITNIEYTEFEKYKIQDIPTDVTSPYSIYPSNTNILFMDINAVEEATQKCTIPGILINMKSDVPFINNEGQKVLVKGGRLESTMQNIADYLTDSFDRPQDIQNPLNLKTFLTYNSRQKTISVAKRSYVPGGAVQETPEGCYLTLQQNHYELLSRYCQMSLPIFPATEVFVKKGPAAHFIIHPSLGPLYSIVKQKIQGGTIAERSELVLNISELEMINLNLKGCLLITTKCPMGHYDSNNFLEYSNLSGKCTLINTTVENLGIDTTKKSTYWKNQIKRKESCKIYLEENAEFFAKDVILKGEYDIHVPKNTKMIVTMDKQGNPIFKQEAITKPTWYWKYQINDRTNLVELKKIST